MRKKVARIMKSCQKVAEQLVESPSRKQTFGTDEARSCKEFLRACPPEDLEISFLDIFHGVFLAKNTLVQLRINFST